MPIEDYFDPYTYDEDLDEEYVTCKYCGQKDLFWVNGKTIAKLCTEDGKPHICPKRGAQPTPDDFL